MFKIETKKDVVKVVRSTIQLLVLLLILVIIIRALFVFNVYTPYNHDDKTIVTGEDNGFIALSYLGVDRTGTESLISTQRLNEHLQALYDNGYVTITQEDIENYYKNGTPLPEKALYLMYEDGRKDTAIFAQQIMEEYNYMATILSYAEKFEIKDRKFLMPKDLLELKENTFWELGSNGYRLSYINVFDRYDRYLGELSSLEFSKVAPYLDRQYNQYLMDFIRDKEGIPTESYNGMKNRITNEYRRMEDVYTQEIGYVPSTYVLMHSNTGHYANNEKVGAINEACMKDLFAMNFNREGFSVNNQECNLYDLTRMQPQAYWYTNHLLMRIWDDISEEEKASLVFVDGDLERKKDWETISGASEFKEDVIALTSMPQGNGLLRLKDSADYQDIVFEATLTGNKLGTQSIYLRSDEDRTQYIKVTLHNNILYVSQKLLQEEELLYELDLNDHDGIIPQSVDENKKEALVEELDALALYAGSAGESAAYYKEQKKAAESIQAKTVEEGAEEYVPTMQINEAGNRDVVITLKDNLLTVMIDGKNAVEGLEINVVDPGYVCLESAWAEYGYSQRNISDDVYDGVFEKIKITQNSNPSGEVVLYDNLLHGWDKMEATMTDAANAVVDWFIENL